MLSASRNGKAAVERRILPPPPIVLTPDLKMLFPVANMRRVPPLTKDSPVLKTLLFIKGDKIIDSHNCGVHWLLKVVYICR